MKHKLTLILSFALCICMLIGLLPFATAADPADFTVVACQSSLTPAANTTSVRLIGTIDTLDYDSIGFRITAQWRDGDGVAHTGTQTVDKNTTTVYTAILAGGADGCEAITAESLGGAYIVALSVNGVPIGASVQVDLIVTPYVVNNGTPVESAAQTLSFVNGVYNSEALPIAHQARLTYANDMTVTDTLGNAIASGTILETGTTVKVTLMSDDKQKIETLYANGVATDLFTVNATQIVSYRVLADTALSIVESAYPITFTAEASSNAATVNACAQGINSDGYLVAPNTNKAWWNGFTLLGQDAVFTTTVKMNRGYSFGVYMYISENPQAKYGDSGLKWYRVLARPWFKTNNVGDFHGDYVSLNNNNVIQNLQLAEAPSDDEVTIKLIFDHTNGKAYVYVNGEDFTERAAIPFTSSDYVQLALYGLCEVGQEAPLYKSWSIQTGAEAVAAALAAN